MAPSSTFTSIVPYQGEHEEDNNNNKATIDDIHIWAIQSPYSPLNLQNLPQPTPNDSREGNFTFRDAFEDLLVSSSPSPSPFSHKARAPASLHVVDWVRELGHRGLWKSYFPLDEEKVGNWMPSRDLMRDLRYRYPFGDGLYFSRRVRWNDKGSADWDWEWEKRWGERLGVWIGAAKAIRDAFDEVGEVGNGDVEEDLYFPRVYPGNTHSESENNNNNNNEQLQSHHPPNTQEEPETTKTKTTTTDYEDGSKEIVTTTTSRTEKKGHQKEQVTVVRRRLDAQGNLVASSESKETKSTRRWEGGFPGVGVRSDSGLTWGFGKDRDGETGDGERKDQGHGWFWKK